MFGVLQIRLSPAATGAAARRAGDPRAAPAPGYRRRMAAIASARVKAYAGRAFALVLVVGVFAFVLPRVADYGEVWDALSALSAGGVAVLARRRRSSTSATFGPPWMAALPGLSFLHALVMSQASTAAASVLPGGDAVGIALSYSMLRRWGFTVEQVTVGSAATTVWNVFANVDLRRRRGGLPRARRASRTRC